ncbi:hypothetical protein [uncultured Parasutterella sp.]|uniref:hypothetical protein n=1 Tax=uncultured Parasutterella sp. TaxID=1263098 RepID=UPI0025960336|nr:hypothetical protein [uncultured Parasutterella sp.]
MQTQKVITLKAGDKLKLPANTWKIEFDFCSSKPWSEKQMKSAKSRFFNAFGKHRHQLEASGIRVHEIYRFCQHMDYCRAILFTTEHTQRFPAYTYSS